MSRVWLATPSEAPAVTALLVAFRDWWGRHEPTAESFGRSVERLLADPDTEFLLGAAAEGEPASGICQLRYRWTVWYEAPDCWLEDLFVHEGARGSGLGRALLESTLERARARGCGRVELDVNESNPAAIALYATAGFSAQPDPASEGRNLLMRLRL